MRVTIAVLLSLAAFAAEAPPAPTKEQARIAQLEQQLAAKERDLAIEETRSAAAKIEMLTKAQADFRRAHARACGLFGIPLSDCGWNGDTVTRPAPQAAAAKPAPAAKAK